ncbi:MAG: hypothetical protein VKK07_06445 [Merismopediaceae bacterium]|nr:hypothetical protein [Merismopediaceae bacterium]
MKLSPLETTNLSSPNGPGSSSPGLLSRLWSWINSYGGLSDLRRYNAELRKQNAKLRRSNEENRKLDEEMRKFDEENRKLNEEMRKFDEENRKLDEERRIQYEQRMKELDWQNARLAELESKLDIVLRSSDSNLTPTISTDNN